MTTTLLTGPCECEHADHWTGKRHAYGQRIDSLRAVKTIFGTFIVCPVCERLCLRDVKANP